MDVATLGDERVQVGLTVLAGIVVPGFAKFALTAAGYSLLGTIAWTWGFSAIVTLFWHRWIRSLDLTGPTA
jgi:hypothetical protein